MKKIVQAGAFKSRFWTRIFVCQNRGFSPNQRYERHLGIPRITRIYADFSFSVRLSIFVGSAFVCVHAAQPGKVLMGPRQYHVKLGEF